MLERIVVLITAGSVEEGKKIASALVGEGLAACVNIVPQVNSIYRWAGEVREDQEVLLIAKSRKEIFERLAKRVKELHSYDVPEVIALPIAVGDEDYLAWIDKEVKAKR